MTHSYARKIAALERQLASVNAELAGPDPGPALQALKHSLLKSLRWYSTRMPRGTSELPPQKPPASLSVQIADHIHSHEAH